MAALTIDPTDVMVIETTEQYTAPISEDIDSGEYCRFDPTTGKIAFGNATTVGEMGFGGVLIARKANTGQAGTFIRKGVVQLGDALDGLDYGDAVYLGDTDGQLNDAAGTVEVVLGYVIPIFGGVAGADASKALALDPHFIPPA
jgi:hypothetical protein